MAYKESEETREVKSEIAKNKSRDESGHFVHNQPSSTGKPQTPANQVGQFFSGHTSYSKNQDDLLNVHVGNPLHKITQLLEDLKKQKAFSFTLKGSLGIMGVFLTLSIFGVLGGGKLLCDKGIQTQIGTLKSLQFVETDAPSTNPILSYILAQFTPKTLHQRVVLINGQSVIHLLHTKTVDLSRFENNQVITTGKYDACSQTLSLTDPAAIEIYLPATK